MAWNNQLSSVSGVSDNGVSPPMNAVPPQASPYGMNQGVNNGNVPTTMPYQQQMPPGAPAQYPQNPMYPSYPPASQPTQQMPAQMPQTPQMPTYAARSAPQATRLPDAGSYEGQAMLGAQPGTDSDKPDTHDDIWIERTKRAISETQNDPHRQVQLLQHLSVLYLKERFNREVQADKG